MDPMLESYRRLNTFYALLTQVNDAVLRIHQPRKLYEEVCRIAVETGPFALTWVGVPDHASRLITPVASAGDAHGYLSGIRISMDNVPEGCGPVGTAYRENRYIIIDDTNKDERFLPWREKAMKCGYNSVAAFPVCMGSDNKGVIAFYAHELRHFTSEEIDLLDRMAANISFAVRSIMHQEHGRLVGEELMETERKYRTLVEQIPAVTYIASMSEDLKLLYVSPQVEQILGFRLTEWMSDPAMWAGRIHADDRERIRAAAVDARKTLLPPPLEYRLLAKDGRTVWVRDAATVVQDDEGRPLFLQGVMFDITEQKKAEEELKHAAFHDDLTGLPNRNLFVDRLQHALDYARRHDDYTFAVFFLDLDRFKVINDSLGHIVGDTLLAEVSRRLTASLRPTDTIARFGGDEFVILAEDVGGMSGALLVAERSQREMMQPFELEGHQVHVAASIGIVLNDRCYEKPEEMLRDADIAMYRAKDRGRDCYQIFDATMHVEALEFLRLEIELRRAIENREFEVHYQPIVSVADGVIVGAETLLRWRHPERGLLSPAMFLKAAEETGQIVLIGEQVLFAACTQNMAWEKAGLWPVAVSVNIAARQFRQKGLVDLIDHILRTIGLDPTLLKIELTESNVMEDVQESVEMLEKLKRLGIGIVIDDFGTGYSSLAYLKRFPVDTLKIDRSFIRDIPQNTEDSEIATAIIAMAHRLGLRVVAEGVESEAQLAFLREQGCDLVQGYLFSRPVPAAEFGELLRVGRIVR